ncbi:MAG: hypothetical protein QXQ02_03075 [Halobacteria archaeon]
MPDRTVGTGSGGNATSHYQSSMDWVSNEFGVVVEGSPRFVNPNAYRRVDIMNLNAGDNTISIPSWAGIMNIIFPASNTVNIVLKGAASDTGISVHPAGELTMILKNPPASFILNASGSITGVQIRWG